MVEEKTKKTKIQKDRSNQEKDILVKEENILVKEKDFKVINSISIFLFCIFFIFLGVMVGSLIALYM